MFGCKYFYRKKRDLLAPYEPETFSLPAPLPQWPQGQGFASGKINLGELEVIKISRFKFIWSSNLDDKKKGVTFYKPMGIPNRFYSLGHYCQSNDQPLRGFVLVARGVPSESDHFIRSFTYYKNEELKLERKKLTCSRVLILNLANLPIYVSRWDC
ncbi:hypothetical protein DITRI_Ditri13aG0107700 [Diplodiscus trichospermus]